MSYTCKSGFFMLLLVLNYIFMSFVFPTIVYTIPMSGLSMLILNQASLFAVPIIGYFFITRENIRSTLSLNPLGIKNGVLIVIISFAVQPLMLILSAISSLLFPNTVAVTMSSFSLPALIIGISAAPAFFEEIAFRGIIYGNLKKGQPFWLAAIMTGLFFGIIHFDGQQFLYAFFAGTLSCFLIKQTNSLFSTMLAHFTINASQSLLAFSQTKYMAENGIAPSASALTSWADIYSVVLPAAVLAAIFMPIIYLSYKTLKPVNPEKNNEYLDLPSEKIITLPLLAVICIYIIFMLLSHSML